MGANNKLENESELNKHLISKGINVPKLYYTTTGNHIIYNNGFMYILYEFIDGKMYDLNTASEWYLTKQVQTLGQIQNALKDYKQLPLLFGPGQDFFTKEKYLKNEKLILEKINQADKKNDKTLIAALNERLKHIKRVSDFEIDCDKLTFVNSHGDFYLNQIIVRNNELVTMDWSHPRYLPACNEVMMSYLYAAPECKDGKITINKFKPYLCEFLKYTPLNRYDMQIMPYLMYYYCVFCSFTPPYDDLPNDYFNIANHTDKAANWLFSNVESLSSEIVAL
jgi:hypothetical protein